MFEKLYKAFDAKYLKNHFFKGLKVDILYK